MKKHGEKENFDKCSFGKFSAEEVALKATFGAKSKYGRLQRQHQNSRPVWKRVGFIKQHQNSRPVWKRVGFIKLQREELNNGK